jgi:hypothetical protein
MNDASAAASSKESPGTMASAPYVPEDFREEATGAAETKNEQLFVKTGVPPPADQVTRNVAFPVFVIVMELDTSFVLLEQDPAPKPKHQVKTGLSKTNAESEKQHTAGRHQWDRKCCIWSSIINYKTHGANDSS